MMKLVYFDPNTEHFRRQINFDKMNSFFNLVDNEVGQCK